MSQEMKKEGVASAQRSPGLVRGRALHGSAGAAVRKLNACEGSSGTHKGCVGQMSQRSALSPASLQGATGKYLRGTTTCTFIVWCCGYGPFSKQRRFPQRLYSQAVSPGWKERKAQVEACKMCAVRIRSVMFSSPTPRHLDLS